MLRLHHVIVIYAKGVNMESSLDIKLISWTQKWNGASDVKYMHLISFI